jgi:hypothetical protein
VERLSVSRVSVCEIDAFGVGQVLAVMDVEKSIACSTITPPRQRRL